MRSILLVIGMSLFAAGCGSQQSPPPATSPRSDAAQSSADSTREQTSERASKWQELTDPPARNETGNQFEHVSGNWTGEISEKGKSTRVRLTFRNQNGVTEGTFRIVRLSDDDDNKTFPIVDLRRSGNDIRFTVPLTGKVDDDSLGFELLLEGGRLQGHVRELREGSAAMPVTLSQPDRF